MKYFKKKFWLEVSKLSKNEIKKRIIAKAKYFFFRFASIIIIKINNFFFFLYKKFLIPKYIIIIIIIKFIKIILPKSFLIKFNHFLFISKKLQFLIRLTIDFSKAKKNKAFYSSRWKYYEDFSKVTAIVSVFNHDYTAKHISTRLVNNLNIDQIIILNDGSTDDSYNQFHKYLKDVNHFILTSNDLNTLRTYDRAIRMARSEYIIIMQDDDVFPDGDSWLSNSLELFNRFKDLGLIGGWNTIDLKEMSRLSNEQIDQLTFKIFVDKFAAQGIDMSGPKYYSTFKEKQKLEYPEHPKLKSINDKTVQFAPACDIGPFVINRKAFIESGGIDFSWGETGKSSCWWETDLCYRFWLNGYSVINLPMHFYKGQGVIGSDQFYQHDSKQKTLEEGLRVLLKKHKDNLQNFSETCFALNESSFKQLR